MVSEETKALNLDDLNCCIVVSKEGEDVKFCPNKPDLLVKGGDSDSVECLFVICSEHEQFLQDGKSFIMQDLESKSFFAFQYRLPSKNETASDTIEKSQVEPPLGQDVEVTN